jgi:hypothetical protein
MDRFYDVANYGLCGGDAREIDIGHWTLDIRQFAMVSSLMKKSNV